MLRESHACILASRKPLSTEGKVLKNGVNGSRHARNFTRAMTNWPFQAATAVRWSEYLRAIQKRWKQPSVSWDAARTFSVRAICSKIFFGVVGARHCPPGRQHA